MPNSRALHALLTASLGLLLNSHPLLANTTQAEALLQQGRVDDETGTLRPVLAAQPADSHSHQLLCRIFYSQAMINTAIPASILTAAHVFPQLAEDLLRTYLSSPAKSYNAPAFKVHLALGDLLAQNGDTVGAHYEYAAVIALASNYAPARKAIQGS